MKTMRILAVVAVAAAVSLPQRAEAINREWSAVLGFLGGVAVANAVNCSPPAYVERPVVYCPPPPPPPVIIEEPCGYYQWQPQRVWVQGCWIYSTDNWGCRRRVWQPGYYRTEQVRVWVPATRVVRRHHRPCW